MSSRYVVRRFSCRVLAVIIVILVNFFNGTNAFLIESLPSQDLLIVTDSNSLPSAFYRGSTVGDREDLIGFQNFLKYPTKIGIITYSNFTQRANVGGTAHLLFHFIFEKSENMFNLLEVELRKEYLKKYIYKWIISFTVANGEEKAFNIADFVQRMKTLLAKLEFFQDNALFFNLKIKATKEEFCFLGFKLDTVESNTRFKEQSKASPYESCERSVNIWLFHPSLFHPLEGTQLKVAGVSHPDFEFDTKFDQRRKGLPFFKDGFAIGVLRGMQNILRFNVEAHKIREWGHKDPNTDEWTGGIAEIMKGNMDMVISSTAQNTLRAEVVDFNVGTHFLEVGLFFKRVIGYNPNDIPALVAPFKCDLWLAIMAWIIFNCIIYRAFRYVLFAFAKREVEKGVCTLDHSIASWGFTSLFLQGMPVTPPNSTLRILYYSQLLVAIVLNAAFSGTLVSFLSVEHDAIQNFKDILSSRYSYEFAMVNYPMTREYLKNDTGELFDIYKRVLDVEAKSGHQPHLETQIKRLVTGEQFGYISDDLSTKRALLKYLDLWQACQIKRIVIPKSKQWQGSFVKKGSRLKGIIDYSIIRLWETGNIHILKSRHLPHVARCTPSHNVETGLFDLFLAFRILGTNGFLSVFILLLEHIYFYTSDRCSKFRNFGFLN